MPWPAKSNLSASWGAVDFVIRQGKGGRWQFNLYGTINEQR
jgi:hypothetical protein